jgi:hypothetical protein
VRIEAALSSLCTVGSQAIFLTPQAFRPGD